MMLNRLQEFLFFNLVFEFAWEMETNRVEGVRTSILGCYFSTHRWTKGIKFLEAGSAGFAISQSQRTSILRTSIAKISVDIGPKHTR